jgi:tetraacyldisaccharide 4'-kinase
MIRYADHHIFHSNDLQDIRQQFKKIKTENKLVLTTEKDAVRLEKFEKELSDFPIYVVPIQHEFLFSEAHQFDDQVKKFIQSFR